MTEENKKPEEQTAEDTPTQASDTPQPEEKESQKEENTAAEESPKEAEASAEEQGEPVEDEEAIAKQEEDAKKQAEEEAMAAEEIALPDLRAGMTVRIHQKITEGDKERVQVFQGIVIALRGKTPETKTVTVQKRSFGILVEKIFPLASPLIEKIEVVKVARVRRSKLYFLRSYGKRLKETFVK